MRENGEVMANGKYKEWLKPEKLALLGEWAESGLIDEQIAKNVGIACSTLYEWKLKYPEIAEALKKGKEVVDLEVENALLKRALGYIVEEKKIEENGIGGEKTITTIKHIPGDTTAQIFWLKNRKPNKWRDKPTTEDNTQDQNIIINISPATTNDMEDSYGD